MDLLLPLTEMEGHGPQQIPTNGARHQVMKPKEAMSREERIVVTPLRIVKAV